VNGYSASGFKHGPSVAGGLAAALSAGVDGYLKGQEAAGRQRDRDRADRESVAREQLLQMKLEDAQAEREALAQLPQIIGGLAGAYGATVPGAPVPVPEAPMPGVPDLMAPAHEVAGPAQPMYPDTASFMAGNAELVAKGIRAGIDPMKTATGGFGSIEAAREAKDLEARKAAARAELDGGLTALEASWLKGDKKGAGLAMLRVARAEARAGRNADLSNVTKFLTTAQEQQEFDDDALTYAPLMIAARAPNASDEAIAAALGAYYQDPKSPYWAALGPKVMQDFLGVTGAEWDATHDFYAWKASDPAFKAMPDLEAWQLWKTSSPENAFRAAQAEGHVRPKVPLAVSQALAAERAYNAAVAKQNAVPAEDRRLRREATQALIDQRRANRDAAEARAVATRAKAAAAGSDPAKLARAIEDLTDARKNVTTFDFRTPAEKKAWLDETASLLDTLNARMADATGAPAPTPNPSPAGSPSSPRRAVSSEGPSSPTPGVSPRGTTPDLKTLNAEVEKLLATDPAYKGRRFEQLTRQEQLAVLRRAKTTLGGR
jgi:hypothetical protein